MFQTMKGGEDNGIFEILRSQANDGNLRVYDISDLSKEREREREKNYADYHDWNQKTDCSYRIHLHSLAFQRASTTGRKAHVP